MLFQQFSATRLLSRGTSRAEFSRRTHMAFEALGSIFSAATGSTVFPRVSPLPHLSFGS